MGFTLVELMIVLTVMGILASLATMSFQDMLFQTRKSQAKSQMNIIYTGMRNFHAEWNQYFGDWSNMGIQVHGDLYYRVGFRINAGDDSPTSPTNYIGPGIQDGNPAIAVNSNPSAGVCGNSTSNGFACRETDSTCMLTDMISGNCKWDDGNPDTFIICGCGLIRESGVNVKDQWTLDQTKTWTHMQL